ncbi:MAG: alpha/beta fold hydrolase [Anaerolineae bacterium]|nr:alpha/beta fold hydrolase [Anaerolineae bacterium]
MTTPRNPHYWRNLARAAGIMILLGLCALMSVITVLLINAASRPLHPARIAIAETPHDYGINDYQEVEFTTGDGVTLRGWYIPSQNEAVIILVHGYSSNRTYLLPEAALLVEQGFGALLFDLRGQGESDTATVTLGDHERRDLRAALAFVIAQPGIDANRIGAIGHSLGAATLTQVAAEDDRLRAVVLAAPFPTLKAVITDGFHVPGVIRDVIAAWIAWREGVDVDDVRPVNDLCNIRAEKTLLMFGDHDTVAPPGSQETMFAAAAKCPDVVESWLIVGAGHDDMMEIAGETYNKRIVEFFVAVLEE